MTGAVMQGMWTELGLHRRWRLFLLGLAPFLCAASTDLLWGGMALACAAWVRRWFLRNCSKFLAAP